MQVEQTRGDVTKDRLIDAAELLFAREGLDVSSRRISQAAGQRNNSAMQYHFASRDVLMEALVSRRMTPINARRRHLLDEVVEGRVPATTDALVAVLVVPLAEQALDPVHGRAYLGFLAQVFARGLAPSLLGPERPWNEAFLETLEHLRRSLAGIDEETFHARIGLMAGHIVQAISGAERMLDALPAGERRRAHATFTDSLVDYVVGGLGARAHHAASRVLEGGVR